MQSLYAIHVLCAALSISGFALRGYWMATDSRQIDKRSVKVLPHLVDTLLLGSALAMFLQMPITFAGSPWLVAKVIALLIYISLGLVALKWGRTKPQRIMAWLLALAVAAYIVTVALTKSVWGPLSPLLC